MNHPNLSQKIRKPGLHIGLLALVLLSLVLQPAIPAVQAAANQVDTPTDTAAATATAAPAATSVPPTATATATLPSGFSRPLVVISWYGLTDDTIYPGDEFELKVQLYNSGKSAASNILATFKTGDFITRATGGVIAVNDIAPGNHDIIVQPLTASQNLWGLPAGSLEIDISYTDAAGTAYQGAFNISIPIITPNVRVSTATPTPTPTPTATLPAPKKAQLVITKYTTDITPLQPGAQFKLQMEISNLGNADARRVTLVIGGGSLGSGGTPDAGGIAGGSGEFTNFAPLGASNIQTLGDLAAGASLQATMPLIVNVTTNPAAYPMKISLVYADAKGSIIADEQVITLLVYALPLVEVGFYRDPNPIFAGQMTTLPLQITNLSRKSTLLGNMKVTAANAELTNNTMLIGALDAGGYFTLDANLIPSQAGPLQLTILIDYTDDFNQPRQITKTLDLDVQEFIQPTFEPDGNGGGGGVVTPEQPETFWQKVWRFVLGIFGLDSGKASSSQGEQTVPAEVVPVEPSGKPLKGP